MNKQCPCGSNQELNDCCGPIIAGQQHATSPEQLMRSRYTAYSMANIDYIKKTMTGIAAEGFEADATKIWAKSITWLGLDVKRSFMDEHDLSKGYVEFEVSFRDKTGNGQKIYELSTFTQINKEWFYTDGKSPAKSTNSIYNKAGRNDPCPCGSEKKYKKCCYGLCT